MISVVIPTLNNLNYLKLCISSLEKNSHYQNELIFHVNNGSDGTLEYLKQGNYKYTHTQNNLGICSAVNTAAKLATNKYLVYAHDDFYFCPDWDKILIDEAKLLNLEEFFLSGTMIKAGQIDYNCGNSLEEFNEQKLLQDYKNFNYHDFQGTTWAPSFLPKKLWDAVGGFSEEYNPGTGSDPDLNMKLWKRGVRVHKGMGKCLVYHFGSVITRKANFRKIKTETGSRGSKIFLIKWGISIKFFEKFYLNGCTSKNKKLYCNIYDGPLNEPKKTLLFFLGLLKCKLQFFYLKIIGFKYN